MQKQRGRRQIHQLRTRKFGQKHTRRSSKAWPVEKKKPRLAQKKKEEFPAPQRNVEIRKPLPNGAAPAPRRVSGRTSHRSANLSSMEAAAAEALSVTPDPELVDGLATPSMFIPFQALPTQCPKPGTPATGREALTGLRRRLLGCAPKNIFGYQRLARTFNTPAFCVLRGSLPGKTEPVRLAARWARSSQAGEGMAAARSPG